MRVWIWGILVLSYSLFCQTCFAQSFEPEFELSTITPKQRTIKARSFSNNVFELSNLENRPINFELNATLPEGWRLLNPLAKTIELQAQERRKIALIIRPSAQSLANQAYQLQLQAWPEGQDHLKIQQSVTFQTEVRNLVYWSLRPNELVQLSGNKVSFPLNIHNRSNGPDELRIKAKAAPNGSITIEPKQNIRLQPNEKLDLDIEVTLTNNQLNKERLVLFIEAQSLSLAPGTVHQAQFSKTLQGKKAKTLPEGNAIPMEFTVFFPGLGSKEPTQQQYRLKGTAELGPPEKQTYLDFSYEGPFDENRETSDRVNQESYHLTYGQNPWDVTLGYSSVSLSELTETSLDEEGFRFRFNDGQDSATLFHFQEKTPNLIEQFSGGFVKHSWKQFGEGQVTFFQKDQDLANQAASPIPDVRRILSYNHVFKQGPLALEAEFAQSHIDSTRLKTKDHGFYLKPTWRSKKLFIDAEFVDTGADFAGRRADTRSSQIFASYPLSGPLSLWLNYSENRNNTNQTAGQNTSYSLDKELGASVNIPKWPQLSISFEQDQQSTVDAQGLNSDNLEETLNIRANHQLGKTSLSSTMRWGNSFERVSATGSRFHEHLVRIYRRILIFSGWSSYRYRIEHFSPNNTRSRDENYELGLDWEVLPEANLSISMGFNNNDGSESQDHRIDFVYAISPDIDLSLEGEYQNDADDLGDEWSLDIALTYRFTSLWPYLDSHEQLKGKVFFDLNNNGVFDANEQGSANLKLSMLDAHATSNRLGDYRLKLPKSSPRGILSIDRHSLPVNWLPAQGFEQDLSQWDLEQNYPIALIKAASLSGSLSATDKGRIPPLKIVLMRKGQVYAHTFAQQNGSFAFHNVVPGTYILRVDPQWLQVHKMISKPQALSIQLKPEETLEQRNLIIDPKPKRIRRTFRATQVV